MYQALRKNQGQTAAELAKEVDADLAEITEALNKLESDGAIEQFSAQFCMVTHTKQPTWWANPIAFKFEVPNRAARF